MSTEPDDMKRVQAAIDMLGEHFDTVQIFTTRHEEGGEGGTVNVSLGAGNFYARYGQCSEWLTKQDERARDSVRDE
jgi:hypothetical protein